MEQVHQGIGSLLVCLIIHYECYYFYWMLNQASQEGVATSGENYPLQLDVKMEAAGASGSGLASGLAALEAGAVLPGAAWTPGVRCGFLYGILPGSRAFVPI